MSWTDELMKDLLPKEAQEGTISLESYDNTTTGNDSNDGEIQGTGSNDITTAVSNFSQSPLLEESSPILTGKFEDSVNETEADYKALGEMKEGLISTESIDRRAAKIIYDRLKEMGITGCALESMNPLGVMSPETQYTPQPSTVMYPETLQAVSTAQTQVLDTLINKAYINRQELLAKLANIQIEGTLDNIEKNILPVLRMLQDVILNQMQKDATNKATKLLTTESSDFAQYYSDIIEQKKAGVYLITALADTNEGAVDNQLEACTQFWQTTPNDFQATKEAHPVENIDYVQYWSLLRIDEEYGLMPIISRIRNEMGSMRAYKEETLEEFTASLAHVDSQTPDVEDVSRIAKANAHAHLTLATIVEVTNTLEYVVKGLLYMQRIMTEGIEQAYRAQEKLPLPWVTNTLRSIKEAQ